MPEPQAIEAILRFRRRLLALDSAAALDLVNAYGPIYQRLAGDIDALLAQIENQQMTFGQVLRLRRYQALQAQIELELGTYSEMATGRVVDAQRAATGLAQGGTRSVVNAAMPKGVNLQTLASVGVEWNVLPAGAFEAFVGIAGDGGPIADLLAPLGQEVSLGVRESLREGIALGRGPRDTARLIRKRFGMGLTRSLRISRTEALRAHREATRLEYAANPAIVRGYRRLAAKDSATCMACIALDGKRYDVGEPLNEHVSGRCALVPIVPTYRELGLPVDQPVERVQNAREWFVRQPPKIQRDMMGGGKFKAWKSGEVRLEDMAVVRPNPVWGPQAVVTPLKELVGA